MKPATDLCWVCQQNLTQILRSANRSEENKALYLEQAQIHIELAKKERVHYNTECKMCTDQWKEFQEAAHSCYAQNNFLTYLRVTPCRIMVVVSDPKRLFLKAAK